MDKLCIIVPCYNEEKVLPLSSKLFLEELSRLIAIGKVASDSFVLFVNDGSSDETWELIRALSRMHPQIQGISLSRNRGHQNALMAGLMEAKDLADITISIDCDGQDDISAMEAMIDAYYAGNDIVYGVRTDRSSDSFFKRITAETYYRILNWLGAEVVYNHADYRLVSSKALHEFASFEEVNLFLRGMFPLVGFSSTTVGYERKERMAGKTHYNFSRMIGLALDGVMNLSTKPLQCIMAIGLLIALLSIIAIIYVFIRHFTGNTVSGWASLATVICFFGGLQIFCIGVVGEYTGKIYLETKHRPRYIISEKTYGERK